ncbi:MAG: phage portal protein [Methanomicrobiales archaeon]|nr:phage portal protein [Methanomicrobiales archaeon]
MTLSARIRNLFKDPLPGLRGFNGAGSRPAGPQAQQLNQIFYTATKGIPRYEDLLSVRLLELSHTVSIPLDTILQQVTTTPWAIAPTVDKPTSKHATAADAIEEFLDGGFNGNDTTFDGLCKQWLIDILSIDAGVLELVPDADGWLAEIYPRDGATFTKNPDKHGRLPPPGSDEPAYYQVGMQLGVAQGSLFYGGAGLPKKDEFLRGQLGTLGMYGYRPIAPIPFSRDQIVWVEENPRTWRTYGFGRIQKIHRLVEIILNQDISNLKYFPSNEIPEGVLNLVEANQPEVDRFREYWQTDIAGNPHKMPILGAKNLQWIPFRPNLRDLQFLESQRWYHHLVWMTFGLNPNEVGDLADVNRSTAQEQAETVWRRTTVPLLELLAAAINKRILPYLAAYWEIDGELAFVWDPQNPILLRQKRLEQESDLRLGLTTPNRILLERGAEPVPWGDMPFDVYQAIARTQPEWFLSTLLGMEAPEPLFGGGPLLGLAAPDDSVRKALQDLKASKDDDPPAWKTRIRALHRIVSGVFADELGRIEIPETFTLADIPTIVDGIHLTEPLQKAVLDPMTEALQHGIDLEAARLEDELKPKARGARISVKKDYDIRETFAFRVLQQRAAIHMRSVEDSVKERVRETLTRIVGEGGNVIEAWRALQADLEADHALLVARTEILGAARYGVQALGEKSGDLVGGKLWKSRKIAGRTRAWHAAMDGTIVPVAESFTVPQLGVKGQPRDYPRRAFVVGDDQPFNCMCDQRLVLREDLPADLRALRSLHVQPVLSERQQEILLKHGYPGETLRDLLDRLDKELSKNKTADRLGIGKATLFEWRRQEGLQ